MRRTNAGGLVGKLKANGANGLTFVAPELKAIGSPTIPYRYLLNLGGTARMTEEQILELANEVEAL
jgi:hypothetical protein